MTDVLRSRIVKDGDSELLLLPAQFGIKPGQLVELERGGETLRLRVLDEQTADEIKVDVVEGEWKAITAMSMASDRLVQGVRMSSRSSEDRLTPRVEV